MFRKFLILSAGFMIFTSLTADVQASGRGKMNSKRYDDSGDSGGDDRQQSRRRSPTSKRDSRHHQEPLGRKKASSSRSQRDDQQTHRGSQWGKLAGHVLKAGAQVGSKALESGTQIGGMFAQAHLQGQAEQRRFEQERELRRMEMEEKRDNRKSKQDKRDPIKLRAQRAAEEEAACEAVIEGINPEDLADRRGISDLVRTMREEKCGGKAKSKVEEAIWQMFEGGETGGFLAANAPGAMSRVAKFNRDAGRGGDQIIKNRQGQYVFPGADDGESGDDEGDY